MFEKKADLHLLSAIPLLTRWFHRGGKRFLLTTPPGGVLPPKPCATIKHKPRSDLKQGD